MEYIKGLLVPVRGEIRRVVIKNELKALQETVGVICQIYSFTDRIHGNDVYATNSLNLRRHVQHLRALVHYSLPLLRDKDHLH